MEGYFKFKYYAEFVIPVVIFVLLAVMTIGGSIVTSIREKRIEKFFKKHGYKRELFDVASFGGGAFYGWVRKSDGKRVDDRDIRGLKVRQIKELYK